MINHTKNITDLFNKGFVDGNVYDKVSFLKTYKDEELEEHDLYDVIDDYYYKNDHLMELSDPYHKFEQMQNIKTKTMDKVYDVMSYMEDTYIRPLFTDFKRVRAGFWKKHSETAEDFHSDRKIWNGIMHNSSFFIYLDSHHEEHKNYLEIKNKNSGEINRIYLEQGKFVWLNQGENFLHRASKQSIDTPKNKDGSFTKKMVIFDHFIKEFK